MIAATDDSFADQQESYFSDAFKKLEHRIQTKRGFYFYNTY